MSHLERNLRSLATHFPAAARAIQLAPDWSGYTEVAPDGAVTCRASGATGPWVHSRRGPATEARRIAESATPAPRELVLLMGSGTGPVVAELLGRFPENRLAVLEPRLPLLRLMLTHYDFTSALASGRLVLVAEFPGAPAITVLDRACREIGTYGHHVVKLAYAANDPEHQMLQRAFAEWLKTLVVAMSTSFGGSRHGADNSMANLGHYLTSSGFVPFRGVLKGQPAVLVGAGPSLARNIEVLREWSGKVFVLAVSSALKRVLAAGVQVHATMVVDYHHLSVRYFDGVKESPVLFVMPGCHPAVLDTWHGPLVVGESNHTRRVLGGSVPDHGSLPGEMSNVAHHSFRLLEHMGAGTIMLAGLDQANSFHISHAPGTSFFDELAGSSHRFGSPEVNELIWITSKCDVVGEDAYGNPLTSDPLMAESASRFEALIATGSAKRVLNCTEGGRRLAGAEEVPLRAALEATCRAKADVSGFQAALEASRKPDPAAIRRAGKTLQRAVSYCSQLEQAAEHMGQELTEAFKQLDAGGEAERASQVDESIQRFNRLQSEWKELYEEILSLASADQHRRRRALQDAQRPGLDPHQAKMRQLAAEADFAQAAHRAASLWGELLSRGLRRIGTMAEKFPALQQLAPMWKQLSSPGELAQIESEGSAVVSSSVGGETKLDATIQFCPDPAVNAAFVGDADWSPLRMAVRSLLSTPAVRRVILPWRPEMGEPPARDPRLVLVDWVEPMRYAHEADVLGLFGWNHTSTLRGLGMTTAMGTDGDPFAFVDLQDAAGGEPAAFCIAVTAANGFLTREVVDSLVERGRSTGWAQAFYTAEGPRGLVPFVYERSTMAQVRDEGTRPHVAFLQMAAFWGPSYAYMPTDAVQCRRSFELLTPRGRRFCRAVAQRLGESVSQQPTLAELIRVGNELDSEWAGELPLDLEIELTTRREINPSWLPKLGRSGDMSPELLDSIAAELVEHEERPNLTLGGHGDPLLFPELMQVIEKFRPIVPRINVRTFGEGLTLERIQQLSDAGVDVLTVRMGVWNEQEYAKQAGKDQFRAIAEPMIRFGTEQLKSGRQRMMVVPEVVKSLAGDRWLLEFRKALYTAVSWPNVIDANDWDGAVAPTQAINLFPGKRRPCVRLFEQLLVFAGGEVPLCQQDFEASSPIGVVGQSKLAEIWNSERMLAARSAHAAGEYNSARASCGPCNQWHRLT